MVPEGDLLPGAGALWLGGISVRSSVMNELAGKGVVSLFEEVEPDARRTRLCQVQQELYLCSQRLGEGLQVAGLLGQRRHGPLDGDALSGRT